MEAEHEVAMAEFADLDVEQEEETFCDEESCGPVKPTRGERNGAKMEGVWRKDSEKQTEGAKREEIAHDGGCVYAVIKSAGCRGCHEMAPV